MLIAKLPVYFTHRRELTSYDDDMLYDNVLARMWRATCYLFS